MSMQGYEQYKTNAIDTMTQGELLIVLYDELVKRLIRAELTLQKEDYPVFEESVTRSIDILNYLNDTLDTQYEIGRNLAQLYEFFIYELTRVKIGRNAVELAKVKPMIMELRDSFRIAQKNNDSGR